MNVSNELVEVAQKKKGGLNLAIILPILYVIALSIYVFVLGNPGNFKADPRLTGVSVALTDVESRLFYYLQLYILHFL